MYVVATRLWYRHTATRTDRHAHTCECDSYVWVWWRQHQQAQHILSTMCVLLYRTPAVANSCGFRERFAVYPSYLCFSKCGVCVPMFVFCLRAFGAIALHVRYDWIYWTCAWPLGFGEVAAAAATKRLNSRKVDACDVSNFLAGSLYGIKQEIIEVVRRISKFWQTRGSIFK